MNSKVKKTLNIILNIILVLYLIFAIIICALAVTASRSSDGVPSLFGYSLFTIKTPSMQGDKKDSFNAGDLIICKKLQPSEFSELKEGDIIAYYFAKENDDGSIERDIRTHRIVSVVMDDPEYGIAFYTMGDNTSGVDEKVPGVDVVAKYTGHKISGGGTVVNFLKSSKGLLFCLIIPLVLFFLYALYRFIRTIMEYKNQKKTKDLSEEEKARIAKEYLASIEADKAKAESIAEAAEETAEKAEEAAETAAEETDSEEE